MRDFRDAKVMAQSLRDALGVKSIQVSHSESLELIAKSFGVHDWNELSAHIQAARMATDVKRVGGALPVMALRDMVLFPAMVVPLFVGREETRRALDSARAGDGRLLIVTQRRATDDTPSGNDLYGVGTIAMIVDHIKIADDSIKILVKGLERAALSQITRATFIEAMAKPIANMRGNEATARELAQVTLADFLYHRNVTAAERAYAHLSHIDDPGVLADMIAPLLSASLQLKQELLEASDVIARLELIRGLLPAERKAS